MNPLDPAAVGRLLSIGREDRLDLDLGKYELTREVGRGGMGIVYEAIDTHLGRRVAIKTLSDSAGFSPTLRQRFAREAVSIGKLSHPHIAQIYDATPDWIAMQFIDGQPLDGCRNLDPKQLARLMRDAALAVQFAHDRGIVHRDLKPSNLLVQDSHIYVVDFGLAKEIAVESSLSISGSILGTPAFMPPEQAQGRSDQVDARSDVYALGATLWTCLAGRPPFGSGDVVELMRQVLEADPPRLAHVDADLETIARKALAKEPNRRYATAAALAGDLDRWLGGKAIVARPPSWRYLARRFVARHRVTVRAIAIVAILLGTFGVVATLTEKRRRHAMQDALGVSNRVMHLLADAEDHGQMRDPERRRGLLVEAEQRCRELVGRANVAQAHYLLGRVIRQAGPTRFGDALTALDRALELDPEFDDARFERGLLLAEFADQEFDDVRSLSLGHYLEQAERDLATTLEKVASATDELTDSLSLRATDVLYGHARLALIRGEQDDARQALEELVAIAPDHSVANRLLAPLEPDAARSRYLLARSLDIQRGYLAYAELPLLGTDRTWRDDGMLVDIPSSAGDLPADILAHAHSGLRRALRADSLNSQGMAVMAGVEYRSALEDLDRALDMPGGASFTPGLLNRAVVRMRLANRQFDPGPNHAFEAFGLRHRAIQDLDAALLTEPACAFAFVNRAIARHRIAEQQAAGGLREHAGRGFASAEQDAERALALLPSDWRARLELEQLRRDCRNQRD